jgi:nicotinic acid mononucleotide adenylyltransferase
MSVKSDVLKLKSSSKNSMMKYTQPKPVKTAPQGELLQKALLIQKADVNYNMPRTDLQNLSSEAEMIFTIGRMNPPHSGHKILIKEMYKQAANRGLSQINIILSDTLDFKNPIACSDKRYIIYRSLQNIKQEAIQELQLETGIDYSTQINDIWCEIICMDDLKDGTTRHFPIISELYYLLTPYMRENKDKKLKITLVIGADRANSYNWIQTSLKKTYLNIEMTILAQNRPPGAVSATEIRKLVDANDFDAFKEKMKEFNSEISDFDVTNMYYDIQYGLNFYRTSGGKTKRRITRRIKRRMRKYKSRRNRNRK